VPIVIIEDEGPDAMEFLNTCLNLVPNDPLIELSDEIKKIAAVLQPKREKNIHALWCGIDRENRFSRLSGRLRFCGWAKLVDKPRLSIIILVSEHNAQRAPKLAPEIQYLGGSL
jgi:hypothetical protein